MIIVTSDNLNKQLSNWKLTIGDITQIPYIAIMHSSKWDAGFDNEEGGQEEIGRFYSDMKEMVGFLKDFVNETHTTKCIIGKFHRYRWFENWSDLKQIDIYNKLRPFLSQYNIRSDSKKGIEIEIKNNWSLISQIVEGGFRYISHGSLFFPEIGCLIEPTHDFEFLFFATEKDSAKNQLVKIMEKHKELSLCEGLKLDWD